MDTQTTRAELRAEMALDPERTAGFLEQFIRDHVAGLKRDGVVLGLSGGIDSAVVAALCTRAVGPAKTLAITLPDKDSAPRQAQDARDLARQLGIRWKRVDITPFLARLGAYRIATLGAIPLWRPLKRWLLRRACRHYEKTTGHSVLSGIVRGVAGEPFGAALARGAAYCRIKHRVRMALLYLRAEAENLLVVGAANKSERRIGFFVKHGCDGAADIMPILGLYKTQVQAIARHLAIPSHICDKPPAPDSGPGVDDAFWIGLPYEQLDLVLLAIDKGWTTREIAERLGIEDSRVANVQALVEGSQHMRQVYAPAMDDLLRSSADPRRPER